jgi:hypothetical protein
MGKRDGEGIFAGRRLMLCGPGSRAAFLAGKGGGGIDGGAGVGIDTAALGADASPVAQQQGAAE